jgi:hypothetical protein
VKLEDVSSGGDRLATLQVLRDRLAREIDGCGSLRDLAALSLRLEHVMEQITNLGGGVESSIEEDTMSELARRRAARGVPPPVSENGASVHDRRLNGRG